MTEQNEKPAPHEQPLNKTEKHKNAETMNQRAFAPCRRVMKGMHQQVIHQKQRVFSVRNSHITDSQVFAFLIQLFLTGSCVLDFLDAWVVLGELNIAQILGM